MKLILTLGLALAALIATMASADQSIAEPKVRVEYNGYGAPNYLVFRLTLYQVRDLYQNGNRDFAIPFVRNNMGFQSDDEAVDFIERVVAETDELDRVNANMSRSLLCQSDSPRARGATYHALDAYDDLMEINANNAYLKFVSELTESEEDALDRWLAKKKKGFHYRKSEHKSSFESMGVDVLTHVMQMCQASARGNQS